MDEASIVRVFRSATSQNLHELRSAEHHLQQLSRTNGFYSIITKIVVSYDEDLAVRFQATLFLKNGIDTIWRKNRMPDQFSISDEEKISIRQSLLSRFDEKNDQINLQIAVIIGKIARIDCPQHWPQLIPTLSNAITLSGDDSLIHNRALLVLYHVVKVLVSKRLAADKRLFNELSARVFNPLSTLWRSHYEKATESYAHASSGLLCLKILRYVVNYGFNKHHDVFDVRRFLDDLPSWMKRIFQFAIACGDDHLSEKLLKITLLMLKLCIEFQEMHALDFIYWLPSWLELCFMYVFSDDAQGLNLPLLKIRSINFLKTALISEDYKACQTETSLASDVSHQAAEIRSSFFGVERVQRMCFVLIKRYLTLTDENLQHWCEEPEIYATVDDTQSWRECLTPAAESFYVALVHEGWGHLRTVVPLWLSDVLQSVNYDDRHEVLQRDALITALGLAAHDLYEEIDFDSLFTNVFLPLLSDLSTHEGHKIVRRRVLWACGKWVNVKFSKPLRSQLYSILIKNVADNADVVLRLTACAAFKSSIDDFEFDLDQFRPYIEPSVAALVHLLKSCHEPDAQMLVVTSLWLLTEHVGVELRNSIEPIISYAPVLWNSDHNMLKCQILNLFAQLVKALKTDCVCLLNGLSLMLPAALDVSLQSHVYLLEEGLDLWLALLENCAAPLPVVFLELFRYMPDLMTLQSENLKICCEIVKSYCAYVSNDFLTMWASKFGETVLNSIDELRNEGKSVFLKTIEMVIRCYKTPAFQSMSGMITWSIQTVLQNQEVASVLVLCCSVVALVSIHDVRQLYEAMLPLSETKISTFLKIWMQKITLTSHDLERRKLFGLGLCSWLTLNCRPVDELFGEILYSLTEILRDICTEENGSFVDNLVAYDFGTPVLSNHLNDDTILENEHDRRMAAVRDADPIYATPLTSVVVNSLNNCQQSRGVERFGQLWTNIDVEIVKELKKMIRF